MQAAILTQNPHRAWGAVLLAAGLLAYAALALTAARRKSATFDEPLHLAAGYTHVALGDFRLVPQHPPLVKAWAALPLLVARPVFREDDPNWQQGLQRKLSRQFFYRWNDGERLLRRVRPMMVVLGGALIAAVFWWTRRGWGPAAAALALLLGVFSPDLLAHGPLVTTDVAVALLVFATVIAFERLTSGVTPARLLCAGIALGAAAAAKFSALSLLPMLAALSVVVALGRPPLTVRGFGRERVLETGRGKLVALAALLLAMAVAAVIVVWATYGFTASARAYVEGLAYWSGGAAREGSGGGAFLLGRHSDRGWWYYFPVTFALKTPLPLIALLALRLACWRRFRGDSRREWFLWLPVAIYLAIAMAFPLNIGHRHLLPIYPFLFAAAGSVAREAVRSRALAVAVGALALWYVAGTLRQHPHHLAYFNEAAGGPAQGYRRLVDSNLDWGQDLPGLKDYLDAHGIARVKLSYFGPADPAWFGIAHDPLPGFPPPAHVAGEVLPGELVAVSATNLQSVRLEQGRRLMRRLRQTRPVGHVGYSILLFRPDFRWTLEQE